MRCRWGDFQYSLGGEVDKAGHPVFRDGPYRYSKPDFLVHMPGDMDGNLSVVEVKSSTASLSAIRADVKKLAWYCGAPARYYGAVLLMFGGPSQADDWWPDLLASIAEAGVEHFVLVRHSNVHQAARVAGTVGI